MKTWIGIAMACLIFSCKKEPLRTEKPALSSLEKSSMLRQAVDERRNWLATHSTYQRDALNVKEQEKVLLRIKTAENNLLIESDRPIFPLQEIIAYDKEGDTWSFGYIQAKEEDGVRSSNGAFGRTLPGMTIYAGYMLFNDGCFHHGTFYVSPTTGYTVFWPDNGYNNNGSGSTGFEDFCLDDETLSGLC